MILNSIYTKLIRPLITKKDEHSYSGGFWPRLARDTQAEIAKTLSVPVAYFFEEIPVSFSLSTQNGFADNDQAPLENAPTTEKQNDYDILRRRETLELIRAYYRIQDDKQRRKVYELIRSMSDEE